MKKKLWIVALSSVVLLSGCGNNENSNSVSVNNSPSVNVSTSISTSTSVSDTLPLEARVFIDSVNAWIDEDITLEHKELIDSAYFIYNSLSEESKNLPAVIEVKNHLDEVKEEFMVLYHEYLEQKDAEEAGYAFVDMINDSKEASEILKEDEAFIKQLNVMYESLSPNAKDISEVITAKEKLDEINAALEQLNTMSDEDYLAYEFVVKVSLLPEVDSLTITEIDKVNEVKTQYDALSDNVKNRQEVMTAAEKLNALLKRIEELEVVRAHAEAFMDAVYKLPTFDKLKWKDTAQDNQIKACENAYLNLTEDEKNYPGVSSAYSELTATRQAFDELKEPYDISRFGFSISLGGFNNTTNNYDLKVMFASGRDPISVLTGYYQLPRENIRDYAVVYLNMYREAGAVPSAPLYRFDITENYNLTIDDFVATLRDLKAQGNDKAVSGQGYNFTINVESKFDGYASSEYSAFSVGARINFE